MNLRTAVRVEQIGPNLRVLISSRIHCGSVAPLGCGARLVKQRLAPTRSRMLSSTSRLKTSPSATRGTRARRALLIRGRQPLMVQAAAGSIGNRVNRLSLHLSPGGEPSGGYTRSQEAIRASRKSPVEWAGPTFASKRRRPSAESARQNCGSSSPGRLHQGSATSVR